MVRYREDTRCTSRTGSGRRCAKSAEVFSGGNGRLCWQHKDQEPARARTPGQRPRACTWQVPDDCDRAAEQALRDPITGSLLAFCAEHAALWLSRFLIEGARSKKSPFPPRPCRVCGGLFEPGSVNAVYCTTACRHVYYTEKRRAVAADR